MQCWGSDFFGAGRVPPELGKVLMISTGSDATCAIREDHTVQCWGSNENGGLNVPADLGKVLSISSRRDQTCALKVNGTVRCWGTGKFNQVRGDE